MERGCGTGEALVSPFATTPTSSTFDASLKVFETLEAYRFASQLFLDSFRQPFPVPREDAGLSIRTPPTAWHQFVAVYHWPDGTEETVGFCNWIRHGSVYLEGGL